jgi:hypothetical protein
MKTSTPPALEKNLGSDQKLIEKLPNKTQELSTLLDASEKTTGKERDAVTKNIQHRSK